MAFPAAIALTWDSNTVRVKCPYSCPKEVHSHGFTIPIPGKPNKRVPHCMPRIDDDGNYVFSQDYRLLFPFEEDSETEGMWWELDYLKKRWRTVSWRVYDPEYWEDCEDAEVQANDDAPNESESHKAAGAITNITNALSSLTVKAERDQQSVWFRSFCVCNSLEEARKMLVNAADATKLVNGDITLDGKPALLAVVEEGHGDMVDLLLQHGADLEARDWNGNTALLRALHFGRGILAEKLLDAGADANALNNDGLTIRDEARSALEAQEESVRIENMMLYPREAPLIHIETNEDRLKRMSMQELKKLAHFGE